jgi:hypothetical protein
MLVSLLSVLFVLLAQTAAPVPSQNATPASPAAPQKPAVQPSSDPAAAQFVSDVGILLVAVKTANTADYELVIKTLQEALAKDTDPVRQEAAKGWRVFKADSNDGKGNPLYIQLMSPAVRGFDYRPSLLLDELVKDLAPELLSRYQESFATPPTRLSLTELANMSVAPVAPPAPQTPVKPPEKKPGG